MHFIRNKIVISTFFAILVLGIACLLGFCQSIWNITGNNTKTEEIEKQKVNTPQEGFDKQDLSGPSQDSESGENETNAPGDISVSNRSFFTAFEKVNATPDVILDGVGRNIDSPEFFETADYRETLLLISGKGNNVVEIWKYPFRGNEQKPLERSSLPNGLAVDQERDWLIIGDSEKQKLAIYSLPGFGFVKDIGQKNLGSGETNLDVLTKTEGDGIAYATESHMVRGFDLDSGKEIVFFSPQVESIEEILIDDYYKTIYVPEENGVESELHPGGAVTAYAIDGEPLIKNGSNIFGRGVFDGDEEGASIYKCLDEKGQDTGHGLLIFADQAGRRENGLELFDRETWEHLGTLAISGAAFTDGIASTQVAFPQYPLGILAVSNNDRNVALISWKNILDATKLTCK